MRLNMARKYFTLCEKISGKWCIQFGAYSRETVRAERQDYRDGGIMAKNLTILATPAGQPNIDAALAALNR
jgi:hypothetical protein